MPTLPELASGATGVIERPGLHGGYVQVLQYRGSTGAKLMLRPDRMPAIKA